MSRLIHLGVVIYWLNSMSPVGAGTPPAPTAPSPKTTGATASEDTKKAIAELFGKPLRFVDLQIDTNDQSALRDYRAISGPIMRPLVARYVRKRRLEATPQEIKEFRDRTRVVKPIDASTFDVETRKRIEDMERRLKNPTPEEEQAMDLVAKGMVENWKFNRALYKQYGGKVILQQAGPEPLEAYQQWLREEEKAGSFRLLDPKWRDAFWEYYQPKYHTYSKEPDPFGAPWWKMPEDAPAPAEQP